MKKLLLRVGALALAAIAFPYTANALPCSSCLKYCLNACWYRAGTETCRIRCQKNYGTSATVAVRAKTRPTISPRHSTGPTRPTSPNPTTQRH